VTDAVGEVVLPAATIWTSRSDALRGIAADANPLTADEYRRNNPSARGQCFGIDEQG
jgi:hypothetical protein